MHFHQIIATTSDGPRLRMKACSVDAIIHSRQNLVCESYARNVVS